MAKIIRQRCNRLTMNLLFPRPRCAKKKCLFYVLCRLRPSVINKPLPEGRPADRFSSTFSEKTKSFVLSISRSCSCFAIFCFGFFFFWLGGGVGGKEKCRFWVRGWGAKIEVQLSEKRNKILGFRVSGWQLPWRNRLFFACLFFVFCLLAPGRADFCAV